MKRVGHIILAALLIFNCLSIKAQNVVFDFSEGYAGWAGDFADYPVTDSIFYELAFKRASLPAPLDPLKFGLMITGNNHSDDLFMFIKKRITGLLPYTNYKLLINIELASDAATHSVGIGGSPAESVTIKGGASLIEPVKVDSNGFYFLNIDKSNQVSPGKDMDTLGNVGVTDTTTVYTLINRSNASHPFKISTDNQGSVWVCMGTDSGFEGRTTIYYTHISLTFEQVTGRSDTRLNYEPFIFPNPVNDWLFVGGRAEPVIKLELYTLSGQIVHSAINNDRLSLRDFQPGAYIVRITYADNYMISKRIVRY